MKLIHQDSVVTVHQDEDGNFIWRKSGEATDHDVARATEVVFPSAGAPETVEHVDAADAQDEGAAVDPAPYAGGLLPE